MKSSFFIVADRGNLKAFRAEKVPADRPPRVQLVRSFTISEGHAKNREINEDADGGFPVGAGPASGSGGGSGRHQNSVSEKHYDQEFDRRAAKKLAEHISEVLRAERPSAWSFAAPCDVKNAVLNELGAEERKTLAESIGRDLVKVNATELLEHFTAVSAA